MVELKGNLMTRDPSAVLWLLVFNLGTHAHMKCQLQTHMHQFTARMEQNNTVTKL